MSYRFKDYDLKNVTGEITKIKYGVMSEEEIVSMSVVDIKQMNSYGAEEPVMDGLFDKRMGLTDRKTECPTCQQQYLCPGHPGKIDLEFPVFLYQFLSLTKSVMGCICPQCSKAYINPDNCSDLRKQLKRTDIGRKIKHKLVLDLCKSLVKRCGDYNQGGCGAERPAKVIGAPNTSHKVVLEYKNKEQIQLNAQQARNIFMKMTDEQIRYIALDPDYVKPKDLIITKLLVQSPHIRPAIKSDNGSRSQDDLTSKLIDIIKANKAVKTLIDKQGGWKKFEQLYVEQNNVEIPLVIQSLQQQISTMIDNNIPHQAKNAHRSGKAIKSVQQRLDQKRGRVRDNLMGKRVDFSARSVITPGATQDINQLGVPLKVATTLAIPQYVNRYNIDRYQEMMKQDQYPGIEAYSKQGGPRIKLSGNPNREAYILQIGDVVYKHLENGDWVMFNRQPSLHKPSLMCHQTIVHSDNSFVLPVNATSAYNADFDGDEMNLHAPVSKLTEMEIKLISNVNNQIIGQKTSSPIIGLVQDSIIGVYIMTKKNAKYNLLQTMNLLQLNNQVQCRLPQKESREYTGKEILSTVLQPTTHLTLDLKSDLVFSKDEEQYVQIEKGNIKSGLFTKKVYQQMTNSLIHQTNNYGGPTVAANLINNTTRMAHQALLYEGFSMGIKDIIISIDNHKKIQEIIDKKEQNVKKLTDDVLNGVFQNEARKTPQEFLEFKIFQELNNNQEIEQILINQNKDNDNQFLKMVESGSKGKKENIMQIQGTLSQIEIEGKRAQPGYIGRTLPHFKKYDYGPESRGFVRNSFATGLSPTEYFFHACAGRVGLCDTAVKTSKTGYIQRQLVKAQEDLKTEFDGSVTNCSNHIIQFLYGGHGFSCDALEAHEMKYITMQLPELEKIYLITNKDKEFKKFKLSTKDYNQLKEYYQKIKEDSEFIGTEISKYGKLKYAVNFRYLLQQYKPEKCKEDLNPCYVLKKIQQIMDEFLEGTYVKQNKLLEIILRYYLNPKQLSKTYSKINFDNLLKAIMIKLYQSLCEPKENVGVIGAQSLGETSSQLVLNSFHLSGASSASEITRGLPRISEILVFQEHIKMPYCHIYLKDSKKATREEYQQLKNQIQLIHLKDVIHESRIEYREKFTNEFENKYNISSFQRIPDNPYLLNFKFDRGLMGDYDIKMMDIKQSIIDKYDDILYISGSDDNDDVLELNIKPNKKDPSDDDLLLLKNKLEELTDKFVLRGIENITKAVVIPVPEEEDRIYDKEKRKVIEPKSYRVETQGCNLLGLLQNQNIDHRRLYTNNIVQAEKIYGIEYAKNLFIKELYDAFTSAGNILIEHIELLACWCTYRGTLSPVNRYGINSQLTSGVLHKASFEETPKNLINGALFTEEDDLNGTTAPLILGQQPKQYGTSSCKIYYDVQKLFNK